MSSYSKDEIRSIIGRMSPAEKAGQLFLLAYPGKDPEMIRPLIEEYGICGCYISQDNAETFDEAERVSSLLQEMALENGAKLPLMLGVDQEGSWGVLVPESHTGPGNLALGALADTEDVTGMYRIFAEEMLSAGYNALLGPCSDVNLDPDSPIIGQRAFGDSPGRVAACVEAAVRGASGAGAITTLKHFPGHGSTAGDTHREIPRVERPLSALLGTDLLPFSAGIRAGADIVMTSHILYPEIDPENPATLSPVILGDLLRKRLGFGGVILSDSMNMGAIRKFYDPAESALMALNAGVDVVMLSEEHYDHSPDYLGIQRASLDKVKNAIESGSLRMEEVDAKLLRILDLKLNKMKIKTGRLPAERLAEIEKAEEGVCRKSVSLLRKNLWPLPENGPLLCVNATPRDAYSNLMNSRGIGPNQIKPAFDYFREALEEARSGFTFLEHEEAESAAGGLYEKASAIVIVTEDYPLPGEDFPKERQQKLASDLSSKYPDKALIAALRSPYDLDLYLKNITYLCTNSSRGCSAAAAARLVAGGV